MCIRDRVIGIQSGHDCRASAARDSADLADQCFYLLRGHSTIPVSYTHLANMNQAVKAIAEAEAYPGPSLIIGYAPCELHGVKGGMTYCQNEMKKAVEAGYWNLFTFNPANKAQGKNPFTLTSKAVDGEKYQALLANETRYSRLTRAFPERAKQLFARNEQVANDRYEHLSRLVELYK